MQLKHTLSALGSRAQPDFLQSPPHHGPGTQPLGPNGQASGPALGYRVSSGQNPPGL